MQRKEDGVKNLISILVNNLCKKKVEEVKLGSLHALIVKIGVEHFIIILLNI
jgi:hypothetical protein